MATVVELAVDIVMARNGILYVMHRHSLVHVEMGGCGAEIAEPENDRPQYNNSWKMKDHENDGHAGHKKCGIIWTKVTSRVTQRWRSVADINAGTRWLQVVTCENDKCTRYCTARVDKRVHSTTLYYCRQRSIVLKPRSDRIDYTVACFMTNDCSRKLRKQYQCEPSVVHDIRRQICLFWTQASVVASGRSF